MIRLVTAAIVLALIPLPTFASDTSVSITPQLFVAFKPADRLKDMTPVVPAQECDAHCGILDNCRCDKATCDQLCCSHSHRCDKNDYCECGD